MVTWSRPKVGGKRMPAGGTISGGGGAGPPQLSREQENKIFEDYRAGRISQADAIGSLRGQEAQIRFEQARQAESQRQAEEKARQEAEEKARIEKARLDALALESQKQVQAKVAQAKQLQLRTIESGIAKPSERLPPPPPRPTDVVADYLKGKQFIERQVEKARQIPAVKKIRESKVVSGFKEKVEKVEEKFKPIPMEERGILSPKGVRELFGVGAEVTLKGGELLATGAEKVLTGTKLVSPDSKLFTTPSPISRETVKEVLTDVYMFAGFSPFMKTGTVAQTEYTEVISKKTGKKIFIKKKDLKRYLEEPIIKGKQYEFIGKEAGAYSTKAQRVKQLLEAAKTSSAKKAVLETAQETYGKTFIKDFVTQELGYIPKAIPEAIPAKPQPPSIETLWGFKPPVMEQIAFVETGVVEVERIFEKPKKVIIDSTKIKKEMEKTKQMVETKTQIKTESITDVMQKLKQETKQQQKQETKQIQKTIQKLKQETKQQQKTMQTTFQTTIQKLKQEQKPRLLFTPTIPRMKPKEEIFFPRLKFKPMRLPTQPKQTYGVSVRRGGEFRSIGVYKGLSEAYKRGIERVSRTAGATFKISGAKLQLKTPEGFYRKITPEGTLFIEKRERRIKPVKSGSQEFRELFLAKKKKSKRKKRRKK